MEVNDQFFYIGELPKMEIIFVSKRSVQLFGGRLLPMQILNKTDTA